MVASTPLELVPTPRGQSVRTDLAQQDVRCPNPNCAADALVAHDGVVRHSKHRMVCRRVRRRSFYYVCLACDWEKLLRRDFLGDGFHIVYSRPSRTAGPGREANAATSENGAGLQDH